MVNFQTNKNMARTSHKFDHHVPNSNLATG